MNNEEKKERNKDKPNKQKHLPHTGPILGGAGRCQIPTL